MRVSLGQAYVFLLLAIQTASQVTHMVTVGVQGSFFVPPTTSARQGDTILFVFGGAAHTVTQSSFESPCTRLQGGFDSGILGRGIDLSGQAPVWSLTVTNDSEPIWFFCELSMPSSHCETGMVGVINPPSVSLFDQFTNSAKAVTSTPTPSPSFIPSGQGAVAVGPPTVSSVPMSSLSITPSSFADILPSSTSVAPSPSTSLSHSHNNTNKGLIAGCAVAGSLLLIIIIALAYFCGQRRSTGRPLSWSWRMSGAPQARQNPDVVEKYAGAYGHSPNMSNATNNPTLFAGTPAMGLTYESPSGTAASYGYDQEREQHTLLPARKSPPPLHVYREGNAFREAVRPLPHVPSSGQLRQAQPKAYFDPEPQQQPGRQLAGVNVDALALEVASVLLTGNNRDRRRREGGADHNTDDASSSRWYDNTNEDGPSGRAQSSAPPYSRGV